MLSELISQEDLALFNSAGRINMGYIYFKEGMQDTKATFEVFIRQDKNRSFFVLAGIHSILEFLKVIKFSEQQLKFLQEVYGFSADYTNYLRNLKFSGEVWSIPEVSICFPNEPVFRVTTSIIQIALIEQFVINTIMHQTMLATKFSRVRIAAKDRLVGTTLVRSHGMESALKAVRLARMVGIDLSAMALASFKTQDTKAESGATTHFFIQSFQTQKDAFKAYFKHNAERGIMLLDTYGYSQGISDFIETAKESEKQGRKVRAIMLDSGDPLEMSQRVRNELDKNGLDYVKILVMGNLEEYKITELINKNAPIDIYGVATEVLNCTDSPKLEVVFKMVEIEEMGKIRPIVKLAEGKRCYPCKKQVFLLSDYEGINKVRIVGLQEEGFGKGLLIKMMDQGSLVYKFPDILEIKEYFMQQLRKYPQELFDLARKIEFPVVISEKLLKLFEETKSKMVFVKEE